MIFNSILFWSLFISGCNLHPPVEDNGNIKYFFIDVTVERTEHEVYQIPFKEPFNVRLSKKEEDFIAWIAKVNDKFEDSGIQFYLRNFKEIPPQKIENKNFFLMLKEYGLNNEAIQIYYYCNPSVLAGISSFPWEKNNNFIYLTWQHNDSDNSYTLSHELGHYFGIRHIFDPKNDIPDVRFYEKNDPAGFDYPNIMNYTLYNIDYLSFTAGQLERIRYNALFYRKDMIAFEIDP
jgi:hypothetical protein